MQTGGMQGDECNLLANENKARGQSKKHMEEGRGEGKRQEQRSTRRTTKPDKEATGEQQKERQKTEIGRGDNNMNGISTKRTKAKHAELNKLTTRKMNKGREKARMKKEKQKKEDEQRHGSSSLQPQSEKEFESQPVMLHH